MNSISSFFGRKSFQDTIVKDYRFKKGGRVSIHNRHGTIVVKTDDLGETVALKATKRASKQEHLDHIEVNEEAITPENITLSTLYTTDNLNASVDYELTVPQNAQLHITSNVGDVKIQSVHGAITVNTGHGDVTIYHPHDNVQASITQQGNIYVIQPQGPVQAVTNKGTIYIKNSGNSVSAKAKNGKIDASCKTLPAQKHIQLSTQQGQISLCLPHTANCSIAADAPNGTVESQQAITLKPHKTRLNKNYWYNVKKQVRGSIGKGDAAQIKLYSKRSNIRLTESIQ